ncbi:restriction endonuclease subunit S, partial [Elizabethkingia meningoseptica]|uniref:restriction endonuclease subunit S n=1 Tax=Elizabethkingia meningoseptica TaxID=238 RepID=UPI0038925B81
MTEKNKSVKKFPNSRNVPKLRFSEFTDEWEERYISEVISSKSKKYNPENSDSNYLSIELESLSQDSGELLSTFDSKNQKSIKNIFNSGDVLFGKLRPYLKKYYLADFDGVCSSEIWVLKSSILDPNYLYAFVQSNAFISLTEISSGSKMPRADWNLVSSSLIVYPPNTDERKKIGRLIQLINSRIQTQRKII